MREYVKIVRSVNAQPVHDYCNRTSPKGEFTCDICGVTSDKVTALQKRHPGKCQQEWLRRFHKGIVKASGIQARRIRRNA